MIEVDDTTEISIITNFIITSSLLFIMQKVVCTK